MPRREESGFVWIKRAETFDYKVIIDGLDVTSRNTTYYLLKGKFTNGVIGEESSFECELDNNDETLTGRFIGNEDVEFYFDFTDGTTMRSIYKVEKINKQFGDTGSILVLSGSNKYHSDLLDVLVTSQYVSATPSNVLINLLSTYAPTITTLNVQSIPTSHDFSWEGVPLYDCIVDLCNFAGLHCYVDVNGDCHLFASGSIPNDNEAIVDFDNLIEVSGIKSDLVEIRNKITVQSQDSEGLPIIWSDGSSSSQSTNGIKETIIKDTGIIDVEGASEVASANLNPDTEEYGNAKSYGLPSLMPGDTIWIVNLMQKIHNQYNIVRFTHTIPEMQTECVVAKSKNLQTFLKARKKSEYRLERLTNPYKMEYSLTMPFDDFSQIDESSSNNITVLDGALKLISGATGTMISKTLALPKEVTAGQLMVVGEALDTNTYQICADITQTWKTITKDEKISFTAAGSSLKVKAVLNSATTRINSLAVLVK